MGRKDIVIAASASNNKRALRKLMAEFSNYKIRFIITIIFTICATILSAFSYKVIGSITDAIVESIHIGRYNPAIIDIIFTLIAVYGAQSILQYISNIILNNVTQSFVYNLREKIQKKLKRLPLSYFDSTTLGDILSRVTNDVSTIESSMQQSLPNLVSSIFTIIFYFGLMLSISPRLTVIGLVTLPLSAFVSILIMRGARKYFKGQQEGLGKIGGFIEESFTGHEVIRAFNQEENAINEFEKINDELYRNARKAQLVGGLVFPISAFFSNLGYIAVAAYGGYFALLNPGALTIGNLQSFILLLKQFTMPIAQLSNMINELQSTLAASDRIFEFLEEKEETSEPERPKEIANPKGKVEFVHVRFGYDSEQIIIDDLNIAFNSGDKVALVGKTGAGKTTLVNLLLRFYDLNSGCILIDEVNITDMRRSDLRGLFGMVLQDTWLFKGTIMENIRYGRMTATDDEVIAAAKSAYVDDFIRTLPDGYNMMIEEDGANLSGGQRQLITIARAILSNPTILILDEATSSVDTRTEVLIQKAMENLMGGRTSFVIAHRLSTIRNSKTILVLENGDIVETGNHEELIAKNGYYAELYKNQLSSGVA